MNNNVLVMREEEMTELASGLEKNSVNLENTGNNLNQQLSGLRNSGLFTPGLNAVNNQVKGISTSLSNVQGMVKKHSTEMFNFDVEMAKKADSMEIPQDFVRNDSRESNQFYDYMLEKTDGMSVNDGQDLSTIENVKDNDINRVDNLNNITSSQELEEEKLDASTGISTKNLSNVTKQSDTAEKKLTEASNLVREALANIAKDREISESKLSETTGILARTLTDISNNENSNNNSLNANEIVNDNFKNVGITTNSEDSENVKNAFNNVKKSTEDLLSKVSEFKDKAS